MKRSATVAEAGRNAPHPVKSQPRFMWPGYTIPTFHRIGNRFTDCHFLEGIRQSSDLRHNFADFSFEPLIIAIAFEINRPRPAILANPRTWQRPDPDADRSAIIAAFFRLRNVFMGRLSLQISKAGNPSVLKDSASPTS